MTRLTALFVGPSPGFTSSLILVEYYTFHIMLNLPAQTLYGFSYDGDDGEEKELLCNDLMRL